MTCSRYSAFLASTLLAAAAAPALAADGLSLRSLDWLWPQLQARVSLQTAAIGPLSSATSLAPARPGDPAVRGLQGGAVFGDYVFARPTFGSFRATSGVLLGSLAGAPTVQVGAGQRIGLTVLDSGVPAAAADTHQAVPYLGVGYNSPALWGGLSVSADLGLVAERQTGLSAAGRAVFGNQATDSALRETRLGPMFQLGVRLSF